MLLFFCLVDRVQSQDAGLIDGDLVGAVVDSSGAVLSDVAIALRSESDGSVRTVQTNATGVYRFSILPPDTYDLTVARNGFRGITRRIEVHPGQTSTADIQLQLDLSEETVLPTKRIPQPRLGPGALETSRELLAGGAKEEKGFGLYSYILFASPPNETTRQRYLTTLACFLDIATLREMEENLPRQQLNVTYVPIKGHERPSSPEQLLQSYDYARARGLLARISCKHGAAPCGPYLNGPYIVSTTRPLSSQNSLSQQFLYQDLSSVPARIVPLWVDEFMKQSAQPEFWQKRNGPQIAIQLRTAVARAADGLPYTAHSVDFWKDQLVSLLSWK